MKKLYLNPLFLLGLIIRLLLVTLVLPSPVSNWYVPFLDVSTQGAVLDPWGAWLLSGGTPAAFPYGYVMWLTFLPLTLLCKLAGAPLVLGYGGTLVLADIGLLAVLRRMVESTDRLLLATYWLSPIVIVASYVFGFNDLVPVLLLALALLFARAARLSWAGVMLMGAISAKLSMVLALPFFVIYLLHNRALREYLAILPRDWVRAWCCSSYHFYCRRRAWPCWSPILRWSRCIASRSTLTATP